MAKEILCSCSVERVFRIPLILASKLRLIAIAQCGLPVSASSLKTYTGEGFFTFSADACPPRASVRPIGLFWTAWLPRFTYLFPLLTFAWHAQCRRAPAELRAGPAAAATSGADGSAACASAACRVARWVGDTRITSLIALACCSGVVVLSHQFREQPPRERSPLLPVRPCVFTFSVLFG